MKVGKKILFDFARFLFRSGEISYQKKQEWEFSKNIDEYIEDTWKQFIKNRLNEKKPIKIHSILGGTVRIIDNPPNDIDNQTITLLAAEKKPND